MIIKKDYKKKKIGIKQQQKSHNSQVSSTNEWSMIFKLWEGGRSINPPTDGTLDQTQLSLVMLSVRKEFS